MDTSLLTRKIGPLPLWAYAAIAGGALYLLRGHLGTAATAATTSTQPLAQSTSGLQSPVALAGGSSVYDPNTGQLATAPSSGLFGNLGDVLGSLGSFLKVDPNAPNAINIADPSGASLSLSNNSATYGNSYLGTFGSENLNNNMYTNQEIANQAYYNMLDIAQAGYYADAAIPLTGYSQAANTAQQGWWAAYDAAHPAMSSSTPSPVTSIPTVTSPTKRAA